MDRKPVLSIICPVFNEEVTVPLFYGRIKKVFEELESNYFCQLIFVDNSSSDRTQQLIRDICEKNPRVSLLVMSRNFGYQCSVEAGLRETSGDLFGIVDVDCEDPPELFKRFLEFQTQGFDVVYGERLDREEGELIKSLRKIYYRLTRMMADDFFILDMAEFCIMNSDVREAILQDNNSFPFIRASIGRVGFKVKNVPYKRDHRIAGKTHYNFWRMALFGIAGILSSSTLLLRLPAYVFPFWLVLMSILFGLSLQQQSENYFFTMAFVGFVFCGFSVMSLSIYLARTYKNGLNRPNYHLNKKHCIMNFRSST